MFSQRQSRNDIVTVKPFVDLPIIFLKKATHFNDFRNTFSRLQTEAAVKFGLPEY